jgi:HTH-type transcriptional regulator, competence development regulator
MLKLSSSILKEREERKLLLRDASALLEIDQVILNKIERNDRKTTKEQILILSNIYKIDKEKLLTIWLADKIYGLVGEEELG